MKAVMFDLDGTLVDVDDGYLEESLGHTLRHFGLSYTLQDINELWYGSDREGYITRRFGLKNPLDFWKIFVEYDIQHRRENVVIYNDSDVVDILKDRGIKVGIVTSSNRKAAEDEIGLLGREKFNSIICATLTEGLRPKPDPQGLEVCMERLGVEPHETCYVGDAVSDVLASRNAGVRSVLLNRNGKPVTCSPHLVIKNLYEVLNLIG